MGTCTVNLAYRKESEITDTFPGPDSENHRVFFDYEENQVFSVTREIEHKEKMLGARMSFTSVIVIEQ